MRSVGGSGFPGKNDGDRGDKQSDMEGKTAKANLSETVYLSNNVKMVAMITRMFHVKHLQSRQLVIYLST